MHWLGVAHRECGLIILDRNRLSSLLEEGRAKREPEWTESVAVGCEAFVGKVRQMLRNVRATWQLAACGNTACLKETETAYNAIFGGENEPLTLVFKPFSNATC